jgi:hypothetical protein
MVESRFEFNSEEAGMTKTTLFVWSIARNLHFVPAR